LQSGSIPHITAEVSQYIFPSSSVAESGGGLQDQAPLQISVDSTITFSEAVGNFGEGISKFVGFPEVPVFLTLHNPLNPLRSGYNDKAGVALWAKTGRRSIDTKVYKKIVSDFKPAAFQGEI
jgi:hypothetical protein